MVKDALTVHEKAKTIKILKDPNRSKKLWENIDILRNGKKEDPKLIILYKENGEAIEPSHTPKELENKWEKKCTRNTKIRSLKYGIPM